MKVLVKEMEGEGLEAFLGKIITLFCGVYIYTGKVVGDIMSDAPPTVSKNSSSNIISDLLRFFPMVVVMDDGKPIGVITKADFISGF